MPPQPPAPRRPRRHALFQALATLAAGVALSMPASAQFGNPAMGAMGGTGGPGRGGRGDHPPMGPGDGAASSRDSATDPAVELARVEAELDRLHKALRPTQAQTGAWLAFAGRVRAQAADRTREHALEGGARATAPDGMDELRRAVDAARNRWTALEDIETAARALYPGLTAAQKPVLDQGILALLSPPMSGQGTARRRML